MSHLKTQKSQEKKDEKRPIRLISQKTKKKGEKRQTIISGISGPIPVARGGSGAKAPALVARPYC